ncbi:GH92 family glycosyl hydrolase [Patescibacteria group bacterium]
MERKQSIKKIQVLIIATAMLVLGLAVYLLARHFVLGEGDLADDQKLDDDASITDHANYDYLQYVDPLIGTGGHGHTYPGATVPFGMIQLSPDNGEQGWDWSSGYHYSDNTIVGFSHTHLSGTGIGDLYDISMQPFVGEVNLAEQVASYKKLDYASLFSHANEIAQPGYYSVILDDSDIKVELTATERVGLHQYTFPETENAQVILDLGYSANWDETTDTNLEIVDDTLVTGYRMSEGWAHEQKVYFAARFSKPFQSHETYFSNDDVVDPITDKPFAKARFSFSTDASEKILVKVGISSASVDGALKSIDTEIPDFNFTQTQQAAAKKWENQLQKITLDSNDEDLKKIFYSALYHFNLAPTLYSDANGEYKGVDGANHSVADRDRYTTFSLWDTFRASHPLLTITHADMVDDLINSMLDHFDQYGSLPIWELWGNETYTMTGNHAIPVITDAILKNHSGFDYEKAFQAMKTTSLLDDRDMDLYKEHRFIPTDLAKEEDNRSVTRTLEYAYDDWCVAQAAQALGKSEDYNHFLDRSKAYVKVFDSETGFMRGKNSDGTWRVPFDPLAYDHERDDYIEGNAWQYLWFVPHDVQGLIELMGSRTQFIDKLDSLFAAESQLTGDNVSPDISGMIGQYAHGNEPSHHIAYLYNYAGEPWKSQKVVRQILKEQYAAEPDGLSGNEDVGQMSAWYVFSSMGFYPVNPASGIYVIGSPAVQEASIDLGGGGQFTVIAENNSDLNIYVQSATLNGDSLDRSYLTHAEIMSGGELKFVMGPAPNKELWSLPENYPPSETSAIK